jgi:hypothetical protein
VGADNSSTSGDLDVFVDQPTETIDPENPHIGCWSGGGTAPCGGA